jgi:signal transduction histidine kinase
MRCSLEREERKMSKRHRRRRRRHEEQDRLYEDEDTGGRPVASPARKRRSRLTPEEKMYRRARSMANRRIGFMMHAVAYGSVLALILVTTRSLRVTLIVAIGWGIGLAIHYLASLAAPALRQQWIDEEVGRQVDRGVSGLHATEHANARSLEDLSASIAHEIRNPVTAAKSLVQQMGEDPVSEENIDFARVALEELDRVERSISHLLKYARDEDLRFSELALPDLIDSSIRALSDRASGLGVELECDVSAPCVMRGDVEKLRRVLVNFISNAIDAVHEAHAPEPRVVVMAGENLSGSEVWLRIRDNGPGIDEAAVARIFDPFYTTKEGGTGLGLALSKKVVEAHGGTLEAGTSPEGGADFLLVFPKSLSAGRGSG